MRATDLAFLMPSDVTQVRELLDRWGDDAMLIAGGMSLMPAMRMGFAQPTALISLSRVAGLDTVEHREGVLHIGATVTHLRLATDDMVRRACPVLAGAAGGLADVQVRSRGTLGGSLANAYPGQEYPTVLSALAADVVVLGPHGERVVPADALVTGKDRTVLDPGELVLGARIPTPVPPATAYIRYSRIQGNYSTVNAAASFDDSGGRLAIGAATYKPVVVPLPAGLALPLGGQTAKAIAARAMAACAESYDDHLASAAYRRALAGVLAVRVVEQALTIQEAHSARQDFT